MRVIALVGLLCCLAATPALAQSDTAPGQTPASQLPKFVVTLALGDMLTTPNGTFTAEATRALADMKGFLPYKRYALLDTAYLIGLGGPHQQLRGTDGEHEFFMRGVRLSATGFKIDLLRLWGAVPPDKKETGRPLLIDTSFMIQAGETVVVGTSRLDGNRALILLVTAVK